MSRARDARDRGTIVIEALVAVLIIAGMAGVLFETVATRSGETRMLAERRMAMLVAQSHLAALDLRASEVPGTLEGTEDGLDWRVRAEPFRADEASSTGMLALVSVSVSEAGAGRHPLAQLRTLRLVR